MTTGDRMRARRKEIGLSAEKVAALLKVSPATIYRYEKGDIEKLPGSILEPLAEILHTTPAYLMGWENDDKALPQAPQEKNTPIIRRIARAGERMTPDQQEQLYRLAKALFPESFKGDDDA